MPEAERKRAMQQQIRQTVEENGDGRAAAGLTETELTKLNLAQADRTETPVVGRERAKTVVETLTHLNSESDSLAAVAHDARNMVTAMGLYCDLLEEPGVLAPAFHHYADELRLVATASHRLMEKLLALDLRLGPVADLSQPGGCKVPGTETTPLNPIRQERDRGWDLMPAQPIDNLAVEVLSNRNLLAALAGHAIALTVDAEGGALPVRMTTEDLTRILVNLVKNAAEAMPDGGRIHLHLSERCAAAGISKGSSSSTGRKAGIPQSLTLTVEDNGRGIADEAIEKIFEQGYTTQSVGGGLSASHHGLGLSITRSIIEAAGGRIQAFKRAPAGTRFEIELPVRRSR
jgi:signal transduction histidine kinase